MTTIIIIAGALVIFGILAFITKKIIKMAILVAFIYLLFNLVFVWSFSDVKQTVGAIFGAENQSQIEQGYSDFTNKRDDLAVLDTSAMMKSVETIVGNFILNASSQVSEIDRQALIDKINTAISSLNTEQVQQIKDSINQKLAELGWSEADIANFVSKITTGG